ncbi:EAL domain-containing protein [Croceicoccus mobilis]|uniref:EAL domain-containing protein n=1 Tax=Croceicoccus mobilis TaxID=1703339 RepID=UPI001561AA29|nr:EAL domain-containing protein [Croceicoccus mobilis]
MIQLAMSLLATVAVLYLLDLPKILDEPPRIISARMMPRDASGEIVMITTDADSTDNRSGAEREALAISALDPMQPRRIVFEGRFPSDDPGIGQLRDVLARSRSRTVVVWPVSNTSDNSTGRQIVRTAILPVDEEAVDLNRTSITGYTLDAVTTFDSGPNTLPRLGLALADINAQSLQGEVYPIDHRYRFQTVPIYTLQELLSGKVSAEAIRGKRVLVTAPPLGITQTYRTPNLADSSANFVGVLAAETLYAGKLKAFHWTIPFLFLGLLLAAATLLPRRKRRIGYAALFTASIAAPFIAMHFDIVLPAGMLYTLLAIYGAVRARTIWRDRAAGSDATSGLPNFKSLEDDFAKSNGRLVVARVENYEEILASLDPTLHRSFINQIAQRLAVGGELRIYTDATGHFAWFDEMEHAKSHITGLLALASAPLRVGDRTLDFACGFGILDTEVTVPRQAISATVVAAEIAQRRASRLALVSEQGGADADWQLSLHSSLDHAIAHQHIYLLFQPQCLLENGHVVGAEALVRWKHPQRGEISPSEFIPHIEKAGRLKPLTAHTLRLAARSANVLASAGARVSVNISATLLAEHDFIPLVCDNIAAGGGRPEAITIEITETAKIDDFPIAASNLKLLQSKGFHISLDDFGTGEANLSLLVGLPCDEIKIDRSFVTLAQHNERARIVIGALCETARNADMRLVAEGIEVEEERNTLTKLGCTIGQGFYYGRPMRIAQLLAMVHSDEDSMSKKLTLY